ncbi:MULTISPECIES: proton-conducting transporter membrane subunit [unclassified Saccharopolyspora]|uniref:proton-conducting transporter transmembrane domain-containing protein n=1 Tax=unclassified Saccharopolyspora TaxID=2646250 RepID=UPI001CD469A2|nr:MULTISPECIES: proton-conducting transporter membrane subunit [unclassified Saccharopolyspora]MCA1186220.1 hydrogenase 4 subunit B [Saccharopolyspora sp. 6T]MCA1194644.1 hydrogenase 4 subunit B [Saccharopolyspora sp. 6V]MCA1229027.1 hydrogenase 4 subunit B [Saccharopolyspora sp. 6M]MCA1278422.1 hydrogenase 4 subunit B [Saccharopolyspora sp. 7B]
MNLISSGLVAAIGVGLLSAVAGVFVPARTRPFVCGVGTAFVGGCGVIAGASALAGQSLSASLPGLLPLFGAAVSVDPLSGVFLLVAGGVAVVAATYGIGYARESLNSRPVQSVLPLFVLSMLLVPATGSIGAFLACWELVALTSLALVLAEHASRDEVAVAGRWYAVMTHVGAVAISLGLLLVVAHCSDDSFTSVRDGSAELPPFVAGAAFLLTAAGFTSKAGALPLHAWLPRAHPEAPSHVSALMSAGMVNLGVYGLIRVGFDLLAGGPAWWWLLVLLLGAMSALHGILQAAMSNDLKRLLGNSTTENMGLVLLGVGAAGYFDATGQDVLASLALTAGLVHVINHAAFKTLLFLSAGSVVHATGVRDLDLLGGLRVKMPFTTWGFAVGALAASALPPGTAFVSEWLLLQALIHGSPSTGAATAIVMPMAVAAVALTAGLSTATFVKAFGIGFLARPRSNAVGAAKESPTSMLVGIAAAAVACVGLALLPGLVLPSLAGVSGLVLGDSGPAVLGAVTLRLNGVVGALSPVLLAAGLLAGCVLVLAVLRLAAARRGREVRSWDCGAGPPSPRMEYTATSFAEPLQRVFENVVRPEQDVAVTHHRQSAYLVQAVEYRQHVPEPFEHRVYAPVLRGVAAWGTSARRLATGSVHRYLGYGFYFVCGVLIVLVVL